MTCPHQSQHPGKDTGRRLCAIGNFAGRPWLKNCLACPQTIGVGTLLKSTLAKFSIEAGPGCQCNARAAQMDQLGPDWCEAHLELIIGWLKEEATRRRLPFFPPAARLLIRRCIAKSRRLQPA
ncbi:MAG: hypothetical protein ACOYM3_24340 [Terrimicrobiaceae bacterium]